MNLTKEEFNYLDKLISDDLETGTIANTMMQNVLDCKDLLQKKILISNHINSLGHAQSAEKVLFADDDQVMDIERSYQQNIIDNTEKLDLLISIREKVLKGYLHQSG